MAQAQFWLNEGTVVGGRYRLEAVLGIGGYGITYRGMDMRLEQQVAVKEYYPSFWASRFTEKGNQIQIQQGREEEYQKGMTRFLEEAKALVHLSHIPAVVRVTDFFPENETAYLVMDYLDGKNLKQMADGFGGRISPDVLIPVLAPVVSALKAVHATGMIHRDISPDNIMMLEDGSVRLIDFGNARDTSDNKSMTLAMKEGFAAPEQYRSKGQGTWTDVYGLCATMYYCLTGNLPPQAMERLMGAPFPRPSEVGVSIHPVQEQAIMDGLDLYVKQRIQTMDELWQRLYVDSAAGAFAAVHQPAQADPRQNMRTFHPQQAQSAQAEIRNGTVPLERVEQEPMQIPVQQPVYPPQPEFRQGTVPLEGLNGQYAPEPAQEYPCPDYPPQPYAYDDTPIAPSGSSWESALSSGLAQIRNVCSRIFQKMKEL